MFHIRKSNKFYQSSKQLELSGLLDFILSRYTDVDYVMNLDCDIGVDLILKGIEKNEEEKLYQKWLSDTARYEMSFYEYKKKSMIYRKSTEEEKQEILKRFGGVC